MLNLDKTSWTVQRLGDLADRSREQCANPSRYVAGGHFDEGSMLVTRAGEADDGGMGSTFTYAFHPGDVLYVSASWYLRKVGVATFDGVVADKTYVLRTRDESILSSRFLPWILGSDALRAYAAQEASGSMNARLLWGSLSDFEVALPPRDEQERIADLLWAMEEHREALARTGEVLDELRLSAETVHFKDAERRYEGFALSEVLQKQTVGVVVRPASHYAEGTGGVPALRSLNVLPGGFDLGDLVYFRPDSHRELSKSELQLGDVVIVRTGRPGDAAVVDEEVAGSNCIDLLVTRPDDRLDSEYFAAFMNSPEGRRQVFRGSAGTAQQHLNLGALRSIRMPLPDVMTQRQVIEEWAVIAESRGSLKRERDAVGAMRDSLLAEIFGGVE